MHKSHYINIIFHLPFHFARNLFNFFAQMLKEPFGVLFADSFLEGSTKFKKSKARKREWFLQSPARRQCKLITTERKIHPDSAVKLTMRAQG